MLIYCVCPPVVIVSYDFSLSRAWVLCKNKMIQWKYSLNMLPEMICICLKSQTPNRLILRYLFKCVYPTVVYVELPKWRCPISERHQQLGPKRRYLIQLLTEIEINVVVFSTLWCCLQNTLLLVAILLSSSRDILYRVNPNPFWLMIFFW